MPDEPTEASEAPAPASEAAPAPEPTHTDLIVDRWFGDYGIPNHFAAAKEELKRRLNT